MREPLLSAQDLGAYELLTYPGYFRLVRKEGRKLVLTQQMHSLEPNHEMLQSHVVDFILAIFEDQRKLHPTLADTEVAGRALEAVDPKHAPYTENQKQALVTLHEQVSA